MSDGVEGFPFRYGLQFLQICVRSVFDRYRTLQNLSFFYCLNFKIFGLTRCLQHNNVAAMKQIILVVRTRMGQMV